MSLVLKYYKNSIKKKNFKLILEKMAKTTEKTTHKEEIQMVIKHMK
jgi:hypothetical protein